MDLARGLCFFFCDKSSGFVNFENSCEVVKFGADSGLCLACLDVRILGPKRPKIGSVY